MRCYLIDEISLSGMEKIDRFLKENNLRSEMEKLFWVEIPKAYLNEKQSRHRKCQPYIFAIELGYDWIKAEYFIRNSKDLRCSCSGYCNTKQRDFISDYMESVIEELNIRT
ncbi:hypothetical protein ACFLZG_02325 [Thermodesulfobacteriota bacterium]